MESQETKLGSTCLLQRPVDEFRVNKQGIRMKTCFRHSKKRDISPVNSDVDQWDSFLHKIKTLNHLGNLNQIEKINVSYTFDLDQLPVNFGQSLETSDEIFSDLNPLNRAIGQLVQIIHEVGGHKFLQKTIRREPKITYYYYCSQDSSKWTKLSGICKRDRHQMERFVCQSLLKLSPQLPEFRLAVSLSYKYHESYVKIQLSDEVIDFISQRC